MRTRIPEWAAGNGAYMQAGEACYGFMCVYPQSPLGSYGLGWGYGSHYTQMGRYGTLRAPGGHGGWGYGSENDAARPTNYGEIDGPQRDPQGAGIGFMATGTTRNGNGYCSDYEIALVGDWFTNYVNAKTWGIPDCEIDLEYVADPTLTVYGRK